MEQRQKYLEESSHPDIFLRTGFTVPVGSAPIQK